VANKLTRAEEATITEAFGDGFVRQLYSLAATVALADKMATKQDGRVIIPEAWWNEFIVGAIDDLNRAVLGGSNVN
jgi:hypothetical protein